MRDRVRVWCSAGVVRLGGRHDGCQWAGYRKLLGALQKPCAALRERGRSVTPVEERIDHERLCELENVVANLRLMAEDWQTDDRESDAGEMLRLCAGAVLQALPATEPAQPEPKWEPPRDYGTQLLAQPEEKRDG